MMMMMMMTALNRPLHKIPFYRRCVSGVCSSRGLGQQPVGAESESESQRGSEGGGGPAAVG